MVSQRARIIRHSGGLLLALSLVALLVADGGPSGRTLERPNTLDVAWSHRTPGRALDVSDVPAALSDSMLAIPMGATVRVVDTRDGHLLSTLRGATDELQPLGFTGGVLLAVAPGPGTTSLNAYDPTTGRKLWHRTETPVGRRGDDDDWLRKTPLLPDRGPVLQSSDGRLTGLAPRTGAVRWSRRMPALAPCGESAPGVPILPSSPYSVVTTTRHLVVLDGCPGRTAELEVMDPETGDVVWKKRMGRWRESVGLSADRDVIGVTVDQRTSVFTESGDELLRRKVSRKSSLGLVGSARGVLYLTESHFGVASDPGSFQSQTLHAVRAGTGELLWKHHQGTVFAQDLGGGVVVEDTDSAGGYGGDLRWSVGDARLQGPGTSNLTDFAGRRSAHVPWPVAGTYVGMSGDLLIVRSEEPDGTRYTALRPGHRPTDPERPVALGGAKRADWPDACGLVGDGLLAELGPDYLRLPAAKSRTMPGTRLPRPSVCRLVPESGPETGILTVTVRWVAPDPKAARTYATSVIPWGCSPWLGGCVTGKVTEPQRGVHLYTYLVNSDRCAIGQCPVAHATVVSGRHVFGVSAVDDEPRTRRLVRRVAAHLARYAAPAPPR
ncbi:outer membrane protein assembly factor BamB [Streptomyces glaucescens]